MASMSLKRLNSSALPSITGLPASGPMSPKPSTAVPFVTTATRLPRAGEAVRLVGVGLDGAARRRHAGRVRQGQVALRAARLGRRDLQLPRRPPAVVFERVFLE